MQRPRSDPRPSSSVRDSDGGVCKFPFPNATVDAARHPQHGRGNEKAQDEWVQQQAARDDLPRAGFVELRVIQGPLHAIGEHEAGDIRDQGSEYQDEPYRTIEVRVDRQIESRRQRQDVGDEPRFELAGVRGPREFVGHRGRHEASFAAQTQRGAVTTRRAVPTTLPVFAAMTTAPAACAVTRPALLTDAIASFEDDHMKSRFGTTMPLELCALATSCTRSPTASVSSGGVTMTACTDGTSVGSDRPLGLAR